MEMFSGHSTERIEPILGITPEPFNTVDVVSSLRSSSFLSNHHMISLDTQRTIRMPVVSVVQAPGLGVGANQSDDLIPTTRNIEDLHLAITLQDPQHDNLASSSPTTLPPPSPANRGLVALDGSLKGLSQFFDICATSPRQPIETLDRGGAGRCAESLSIHRNAQNEKFQQPTLRCFRQTNRRPGRRPRVALPTGFALKPTVSKFVRSSMTTSITSSHVQTIVNLVRFG